MDNNPNVGMICLSHTEQTGIKTDQYEDENFYSRVINEKCMIWCRICLYRREYLLKLLRDHETIWEFEKYASARARKLDYIILQQNSNKPEVFTFKIKIEEGFGITRRKWLPKNVELFEKYGIDVNYENLGLYAVSAVSDKPKQNEIKKSDIREILYKVKHFLKELKKKANKLYRKYKSR